MYVSLFNIRPVATYSSHQNVVSCIRKTVWHSPTLRESNFLTHPFSDYYLETGFKSWKLDSKARNTDKRPDGIKKLRESPCEIFSPKIFLPYALMVSFSHRLRLFLKRQSALSSSSPCPSLVVLTLIALSTQMNSFSVLACLKRETQRVLFKRGVILITLIAQSKKWSPFKRWVRRVSKEFEWDGMIFFILSWLDKRMTSITWPKDDIHWNPCLVNLYRNFKRQTMYTQNSTRQILRLQRLKYKM